MSYCYKIEILFNAKIRYFHGILHKEKNDAIMLHMHYPTCELAAVFPISILKMHFLHTSEDTLKISGIYKDMK